MTRKILQQAHDNAKRLMGKCSVEAYGGPHHAHRQRYDMFVMAEDLRLLREAGVVVVEGLACEESIAAQRATVERARPPGDIVPIVPAEPKPTKRKMATGSIGKAPPGWIVVHVPVTAPDGRNRDRFEAVEDLRDRPWFTELVSVGTGLAAGEAVHAFARPPDGEERPAHRRVLDLDRKRDNAKPDRPPEVARSFTKHGRVGWRR
jgi:hypothetical protein